MKKYLFFAATAAMMLASCSSEVDFTQQDLQQANAENAATPVQFGTYLGKTATTRAGATGDIVSPSAASGNKLGATNYEFGVIAFNHKDAWETAKSSATPNFMYNQKVSTSDNGTTWTYTPLKYWPNGKDGNNPDNSPSNSAAQDNTNGKYLSFFAYAPYVEKTSDLSGSGITKINNSEKAIGSESSGNGNTKVGEPTVDYSFASNDFSTSSNVDLLWGLRNKPQYDLADGTDAAHTVGETYNTDLTKQNTIEKVSFLFKHALAKIGGSNGLKIVADFDGNGVGETGYGSKDATTLITVKSITIGYATNAVTTNGTFNLATGAWTATNGTINESTFLKFGDGTSSTIEINNDVLEPAAASTSCPVWSTTNTRWETNSSGSTSGTEFVGVTTTAKNVYKTTGDAIYLIPGQDDQKLTVTVDYIVRTYDGNLAVPTNEVSGCSKVEQSITNTVTLPASLLASNKYYALVLHLGLTSVKFTAQVADWDDAGAGAVEEVWLPSNVVAQTTSTTLAAGASSTVNTAASTTSYTITVTGLTASEAWSATVASGDASISSSSGTTSSTSQDVTVTLTANANTTATKENVITFTCNGTTTTITIIQAKATS